MPVVFDPGSFRDRDSRVFLADSTVYRALSPTAFNAWQAVSEKAFFRTALERRAVVTSERVEGGPAAEFALEPGGAVLRHERIPFISYPYEWCFSMLREAALTHLDLLEQGLPEGVILKDATPFNVQFRGASPIFIDIGSFVPHEPGDAWTGYRQFCQMMLYPLMLQAYRRIDFQPFLRGRISGVSPTDFARMQSFRDWFRRGVLTHVVLHAALESRAADSDRSVSTDLKRSGFDRSLILANLRKLRSTIERMKWNERRSTWSDYDADSEPVRRDAAAKEQFVRRVVEDHPGSLAWDLGCNLGRYSRIAAEKFGTVVSMDSDHWTIERLFHDLREERNERIVPLVMNLADPSPGLGWRGRERRPLDDRGKPDLILALALIHHLVIRENLRIEEVLEWFRGLGSRLVIEFVDRDDPQVRILLRNRADGCEDYNRANFDRALAERFEIVESRPLEASARTLYHAVPRK